MSDCASIDPFITPYVDGDIGVSERRLVDDHMRVCAPCHSRVSAERAVHELIRTRRTALACDTASARLRDRCAAMRSTGASADGSTASVHAWRKRFVPLAVAAGAVLVAGAASVYLLTERSTKVLAAELTADHVKCFGMSSLLPVNADPDSAERTMASTFGWHMPLADAAAAAGMELLGARVCLYGRGLAAHLMYRRNGQPVSVFMIPKSSRAQEVVDVMGHEAAIWSTGGRTFVLVARAPEDRADAAADLSRMTSVVQAALH
jgi:anti-sigma factor RsiW